MKREPELREDDGGAPRRIGLGARLARPFKALFTQGLSPRQIAWTLAIGTGCSLFPFLGATSLLNLGVGLALGLNQPLLQTWNQLLGPLQLVLILVYVRLGEVLLGAADAQRFRISELVSSFSELSLGEFFERFGQAGLHAFVAWLVTLPLLVGLVGVLAWPLVRRIARMRDKPSEGGRAAARAAASAAENS